MGGGAQGVRRGAWVVPSSAVLHRRSSTGSATKSTLVTIRHETRPTRALITDRELPLAAFPPMSTEVVAMSGLEPLT